MMCLRRAWKAVIVLILAILAMAPAFAALAETIEVRLNADTKIYASASTSARSVKASKDLQLSLKSYANGWGMVTYKGNSGYVKLKYLDRVDPIPARTTDEATVYKSAGSDKLGSLDAGVTVYVIGVDGAYAHVCDQSGDHKGYVKSSLLAAAGDEPVSSAGSAASAIPAALRSTTSANTDSVEYAIYIAQNLMGAAYAADANPPESFDSAAFTAYCYGMVQSDCLSGSARNQGGDARYAQIDYDGLERGDLVCFDTVSDGNPSDHVGIYIGNGYFIHASSAAEKVILSSLKSGYYKRTFSLGRRIF